VTDWALDNSHLGLLTTVLAIVFVFGVKQLTSRMTDDLYDGIKGAGRWGLRWLGRRQPAPGSSSDPESVSDTAPTAPAADGRQPPASIEPTPQEALATPRGRYADLSLRGDGELATIHDAVLVTNDDRRVPVVIKVARTTGDNHLLQNEVTTLRTLAAEASQYAKHLPEVLDQFRDREGRLATVQRRIDGLDLPSLRARFPKGLESTHVCWIFQRALSVLGYAHKQGILHGNIEPAHLLVRPRDHNVWLVDWCYAIARPRETGQAFRIHNPRYSAPEVAERRPPLPAADLYSLGATMIELLGGDPVSGALPPATPPALQRLLGFFVRPSAIRRPQDAWEMYQKLKTLREEMFGPHRFLALEL